MFKNKIVTFGLAGMLSMSLGLAACGSQSASTQQSSSDTATTENATKVNDANKILYWEGKASDGQDVCYMHNDETSAATLAITKPDASDGKYWSGKAAQKDSAVTITDDKSKETVTLTVVDAPADFSSLKVNIDGYGEVDMKPTTQAEFDKEIEEVATSVTAAAKEVEDAMNSIAQFVMYWEGTLADGQTVTYVDDANSKEAVIAIIKSGDESNAKGWAGKVTVTDGKSTITDNESKETITYAVVSGGADSSSMKLSIDGYGEVELKPVTGNDVANEAGKCIEKLAKEAETK